MQVISAGGAPPIAQAYARANVSTAANLTAPTSAAELDPSLRVTVPVPASGTVLVRQSGAFQFGANPLDAILYVQVDGTGPWTVTGGAAITGASAVSCAGEVELTGLTPGSHTFSMGWSSPGGSALGCSAAAQPGFAAGTWNSVLTLP